jgi:DNA-binding FadR family transcriptional regulator
MSIASNAVENPSDNKALIRRVVEFARDHGYGPGERMPAERALAEKLGVGRNALREALATLETLRVVEMRPNSGIYLRPVESEGSFEAIVLLAQLGAPPSATEVRESIEVRASLEREAITLACARRTDADLATLADNLRDTKEVLAEGGNIVDCDQGFHLAVARASHNSVLTRMLNAFYCLTLARRREYFSDPARGATSLAAHRRIVAALKKRDAVRAMRLVGEHLGNAQVYWKEALARP